MSFEIPKDALRALHVYRIPTSCQCEIPGFGVIKEIGLRELTPDDEMMAAQRSRNNNYRTAHELSKACLAQVNGTNVSLADGSSDAVWNAMPPKLRTLVVTAYTEIHVPSEDDAAVFTKSRVIKV